MRPYAKTHYKSCPEVRIVTAFPPAKTAAIPGNPILFTFDVRFAGKVAKLCRNYRGLTVFPGKEESDFPVSYKADEK